MTRGNQREIDRQRAANRNSAGKGGEAKGGDHLARKVSSFLEIFFAREFLKLDLL